MQFLLMVLIAGTVIYFIMAVFYSLNASRFLVAERLHNYTREEENAYLPPELAKPFKERVLGSLAKFLMRTFRRIIPQRKKDAYEKRLTAAGNPHGMHAEEYVVFKYFVLFFMLILGIVLWNFLSFLVLTIAGFVIPDLYLKTNEKKRKEAILQSMPDILDLLSVSVEAGLSFDSALQKVVEKYDGPLTTEFEKAIQEINMGKPRRDALRDMGARVEVDEVTTFLGSIIQADQLGVSITNVLKLQSQQVRANRRMRAEEKAQKAPIKILIPLVMFIFPTILIVLLGPAVIRLMDTL